MLFAALSAYCSTDRWRSDTLIRSATLRSIEGTHG